MNRDNDEEKEVSSEPAGDLLEETDDEDEFTAGADIEGEEKAWE